MKLNDLDSIQSQLISLHQHDGFCWNCKHLADDVNATGEFTCNHPVSNLIKHGETVDNLVWRYLAANNLEDEDISDFGVGNYCSLYKYDEINIIDEDKTVLCKKLELV
jgi:hypothetical protein